MPPCPETPTPLETAPEQSASPDIPAEHITLIGHVVLEWSRLEKSLEELIWAYLGVDVDEGRIITARLDARYKMNMFRGLAEVLMQENDFSDMRRILHRMAELYSVRSLVVHGNWFVEKPGNVVAVMSLREKLPDDASRDQVVTTDMPASYLRYIVGRMIEMGNVFIELRDDILSSSPEIPVSPFLKDSQRRRIDRAKARLRRPRPRQSFRAIFRLGKGMRRS